MEPVAQLLLLTLIVVAVPHIPASIHKASTTILPPVVLQILTGLALGPDVLGRLWPPSFATLFSATTTEVLNRLAELALVLFGFTTGMHLQWRSVRTRLGMQASAWALGLVGPLLLGAAVALCLLQFRIVSISPRVPDWQFVAALAICCAVTALPVLSALLHDMGLHLHRLGQMALAIASGTDLALWIVTSALLAAAGAAVRFRAEMLVGPGVLVVFGLLVHRSLSAVDRAIRDLSALDGTSGRLLVVLACSVALTGSLLAETFGLHFVMGSVTAGIAVPAALRTRLLGSIEPLTLAFLMPFFFLVTGLRMQIGAFPPHVLVICAAITLASIVGKFGGVALAARLSREDWSSAIALGALVQTKGLMELVIAAAFADRGLFGPDVFSAIVVMTVVCTGAAAPIVRVCLRGGSKMQARQDRAALVG